MVPFRGTFDHTLDAKKRLTMPARYRSALPPHFTLRVPVFNVAIAVQRVWVGSMIGASSQLCCGGALAHNPQRSADSWRSLVELTPGIDGRNTDLHTG